MFGEYWSLALLSGVLVLLTPCVFPLLPLMFSSLFGPTRDLSQNNGYLKTIRTRGVIFIFVIWVLFVVIGLLGSSLFTVIDIYSLSTHPIWNLFLGSICIFFAANLLGIFELRLPAMLLQKIYIQEQNNSFEWIKSIFLALLFISTTFTCTAPFIGTLLLTLPSYQSLLDPILYLWLFSLGLTSPFIFIMIFPNIKRNFQIPGETLMFFKQTIGVIEICAAIKFFSNADLVWQLDLLSKEIMLSIWLSIMLFWSILICIKGERILRNSRQGILYFLFAGFFILMIFHVLLLEIQDKSHFLSSYLPPQKNSNIQLNNKMELNSRIFWYEEIEKAQNVSLDTNKMIFIDFTGFTCINCRWMEKNIFSNREVQELLEENFVLVKLYTDGLEDRYQKNQKLQHRLVNSITLPYYAIVDTDLNVLFEHAGLERDVNKFIDFLTTSVKDNYLVE